MVQKGLYVSGVGNKPVQVVAIGPYISPQFCKQTNKTVLVIDPEGYYAPGCNCSVYCATELKRFGHYLRMGQGPGPYTSCDDALVSQGHSSWLKTSHGLVMLPRQNLGKSMESVHMPFDWLAQVLNKEPVYALTKGQRRNHRQPFHQGAFDFSTFDSHSFARYREQQVAMAEQASADGTTVATLRSRQDACRVLAASATSAGSATSTAASATSATSASTAQLTRKQATTDAGKFLNELRDAAVQRKIVHWADDVPRHGTSEVDGEDLGEGIPDQALNQGAHRKGQEQFQGVYYATNHVSLEDEVANSIAHTHCDHMDAYPIHLDVRSSRTKEKSTVHDALTTVLISATDGLPSVERARLTLRRLGHVDQKKAATAHRRDLLAGAHFPRPLLEDPSSIVHNAAKFRETAHKPSTSVPTHRLGPLEMQHVDHVSGFGCSTVHKATSFYLFACHETRYLTAKLVTTRSNFPVTLDALANETYAIGREIKELRSDGGTEITSSEAALVRLEHGITASTTPPHDPAAGGFHEKAVGDVCRTARALLFAAPHIPHKLWGLAIMHAVLILNCLPYAGNRGDMSPFQAVFGHVPSVMALALHVWGCRVSCKLYKSERIGKKLHELTYDGYFVGRQASTILVYDPQDDMVKAIGRTKVVFHEYEWTAAELPDLTDSSTGADAFVDPVARVQRTVKRTRPEGQQASEALAKLDGMFENLVDISNNPIFTPTTSGVLDADLVHASARSRTESEPASNMLGTDKTTTSTASATGTPPPTSISTEATAMATDTAPSPHATAPSPPATAPMSAASATAPTLPNGWPEARPVGGSAKPTPRASLPRAAKTTKVMAIFSACIACVMQAAAWGPDMESLKYAPPPKNTLECLLAPDYVGWWAAMRSERNSWVKLGVYEEVLASERAPDSKTVPLSPVFKRKYCPKTGKHIKNKMRAVTMGQLLKKDVNFGQTFAPCASAETIKTFAAICAESGYTARSADVSTAYLQAQQDPNFKIYVHKPNYVKVAGWTRVELESMRAKLLAMPPKKRNKAWQTLMRSDSDKVWSLKTAVYGSPDAASRWSEHLCATLKNMGLTKSKVDSCVHWRHSDKCNEQGPLDNAGGKTHDKQGQSWLMVVHWVDDVCYVGTPDFVADFEKGLKDSGMEHTINDNMDAFVGLVFKQDHKNGTVEITVPSIIEQMEHRFAADLKDIKSQSTPHATGASFKKATPEEVEAAKHKGFQSLMGILVFCTHWCHVECSCVVSMLAAHMSAWNKDHYSAALRVARFLIDNKHKGLIFSRGRDAFGANTIYSYSDADLATDESRKSRSGILIMMNGAALVAKSKLQTTVQLSTACAELLASCATCNQVQGFRHLMREAQWAQTAPTIHYCDNTAALSIVINEGSMAAMTKHLDMRRCKLKEYATDETIHMQYVRSNRCLADILTKCLPRPAFETQWNIICGYTTAAQPMRHLAHQWR
jgi:hypothetical protein